MEFLGQPKPSGACNFLEVPGFSSLDADDDDCEVVINIRPKSSPLPRRKTSVSDEDSEPEPPLCGSRRVSFADAKGLSLVQIKEFDQWDTPKLQGYESADGDGKDADEYFLLLLFSLPLSSEELCMKVSQQKVELENIELFPGTTILKGVIRVLNISFIKAVYVRTTLDSWHSHFDLLAEYMPGSSDGETDCFLFKLILAPPFNEQGRRVDFCLRYETPVGTFWANNSNRNYSLFCHKKTKEQKEKSQRENINKKSCLKPVSQNLTTAENLTSVEASPSQDDILKDVWNHCEEQGGTKTKELSESQSGVSDEEGQGLQIERTMTCSQKSHQKAAQVAQVRDYFSQRDGVENDVRSDLPLLEVQQAPQEEKLVEKHSDIKPVSGERVTSGGAPFVSELLETYSRKHLNIQRDTPPEQASNSTKKPEKSEGVNSLMGEWSDTDTPESPYHQNTNTAVSKHEEVTQDMSCDHRSGEEGDDVISRESRDGSSFTFGIVVAPLCPQAFGKTGGGNQSSSVLGSPPRDFSPVQNERQAISSTIFAPTSSNSVKIQTEESTRECLDDAFHLPEKMELSLHCPPEVSTPLCPHTLNILEADLLSAQLSMWHLKGNTPEDHLTHDLHQGTAAEAAQTKLPELAGSECQTVSLSNTHAVGLQTSPLSPQSASVHVCSKTHRKSCEEADYCKPAAEPDEEKKSSTISLLKNENLFKDLHRVDPNNVTHWETGEEKDPHVTRCETSPEAMEESNIVSKRSDGETNSVPADAKARMDEDEAVLESTKFEMKDTVLTEVFSSVDTTEEFPNTWESMVEDEERGIKSIIINAVETEAVEKDESEEGNVTEGTEKEIFAESKDDLGNNDMVQEGETGNIAFDNEKEAVQKTTGYSKGAVKEKDENEEITVMWEGCVQRIEEEEIKEEDLIGGEMSRGGETYQVQPGDEVGQTVASAGVETKGRDNKVGSSEKSSDDDGLSALMNNVQQDSVEDTVIDEENTQENFSHDPPKSAEDKNRAEEAACLLADEPESDQTEEDSTSTESVSDDEVELYMHCLRAVHTNNREKDVHPNVTRTPSACRGKLSTPMPSISESLDEEKHLFDLQEEHEDMETAAEASSEESSLSKNASRWKETLSCSNISKNLLYVTLCVIFLVVSHHYDFLACFGLYLITLIWLCCREEKQPVNGDKID